MESSARRENQLPGASVTFVRVKGLQEWISWIEVMTHSQGILVMCFSGWEFRSCTCCGELIIS